MFRCFLSEDMQTSESKSRDTWTSRCIGLGGSATSLTLATAVALLVVGGGILLWGLRLCKKKLNIRCKCQQQAVSL